MKRSQVRRRRVVAAGVAVAVAVARRRRASDPRGRRAQGVDPAGVAHPHRLAGGPRRDRCRARWIDGTVVISPRLPGRGPRGVGDLPDRRRERAAAVGEPLGEQVRSAPRQGRAVRTGGGIREAGEREPGEPRSVLVLGPTLPASDLRFEHVLAPAVAAGRLEKREVRRAPWAAMSDLPVGRLSQCERHRPSDRRRLGRQLHRRRWTPPRGGLVLTRGGDRPPVAVQVNETVKIPEEVFALGEASIPASKGGGSMRRLKDGSTPPGPFFVADAIPEGFVLRGRYSVIPPQPENFGEDPEREDFRRAMVSDVYERGNDVLVLEQGATFAGHRPSRPTPPTRRSTSAPSAWGKSASAPWEIRCGRRGRPAASSRPPERWRRTT